MSGRRWGSRCSNRRHWSWMWRGRHRRDVCRRRRVWQRGNRGHSNDRSRGRRWHRCRHRSQRRDVRGRWRRRRRLNGTRRSNDVGTRWQRWNRWSRNRRRRCGNGRRRRCRWNGRRRGHDTVVATPAFSPLRQRASARHQPQRIGTLADAIAIGACGASKLPSHLRCAHIADGAEGSQLPRRITELPLQIKPFERSRADPGSARQIANRPMERVDEIDN